MNTPTPDTTEVVTLKPCPFCTDADAEMPPVATRDKAGYLVVCTSCSALGPTRTTEADAIDAWNTRYDSAGVPDGLVERLRSLDCTMVEICEPCSANPSRNIIPIVRADLIAALSARPIPKVDAADEALAKALAWYGEQARLARLIHREGDAGRHALAADGGKRAQAALAVHAGWRWWAGSDEEEYRLSGPCVSKAQAIDEAYGNTEPGDTIYLVEAITDTVDDGDGLYPFIETRNRCSVVRKDDAPIIASTTDQSDATVRPTPNYEAAWKALSEPLWWMHDNPALRRYWGWGLAEIANDLIDRAYPGLRAPLSPSASIPEGMVPWEGGQYDAPRDWDGGPVLRRNGAMSMPCGQFAWESNLGGPGNIIAYTPLPDSLDKRLRAVREALRPFALAIRADVPDDQLVEGIAWTAAQHRAASAAVAASEPRTITHTSHPATQHGADEQDQRS